MSDVHKQVTSAFWKTQEAAVREQLVGSAGRGCGLTRLLGAQVHKALVAASLTGPSLSRVNWRIDVTLTSKLAGEINDPCAIVQLDLAKVGQPASATARPTGAAVCRARAPKLSALRWIGHKWAWHSRALRRSRPRSAA